MKLIATEYAFDDSKILFYFTADGRIDFRELVKDLASVFRRRIELRQIGVRDETKILGGMGVCGRPLCCHTYLNEFVPVSIKMAKEQNLSLNPTKISGTCGRLMCCLKNEADTYADLKKGLPVKGDQATTPDGRHGEVQSVNILRQLVKIVVDVGDDEKELQEYPVSEITFIPHSKKQKNQPKKKDKAEGKEKEKGKAGGQPQESAEGGESGEGMNAEQKKFRQTVKKVLENQQAADEDRARMQAAAQGGQPPKRGQKDGQGNRSRRERSSAKPAGDAKESASDGAQAAEETVKKSRRRRHHRKKAPTDGQTTG